MRIWRMLSSQGNGRCHECSRLLSTSGDVLTFMGTIAGSASAYGAVRVVPTSTIDYNGTITVSVGVNDQGVGWN